jgi:hypothetical protein
MNQSTVLPCIWLVGTYLPLLPSITWEFVVEGFYGYMIESADGFRGTWWQFADRSKSKIWNFIIRSTARMARGKR